MLLIYKTRVNIQDNGIFSVAVKCINNKRNINGEGNYPDLTDVEKLKLG